ncbi:MAG TPA: hypothetical protein VFO57_01120 [Burkholderiales bacterium]|nr:hypothetical protein [Burkholderiales bacterium]
MTDNLYTKIEKGLAPPAAMRGPGMDGKPQSKTSEDDFPGEFEKLKLSVIRPAFETFGNGLKERGHQFNISEEPGGKISIHIVPPGVKKSIHPYDWFPTFSFFGAPFPKTVGLHGRNMRPNSEPASGSRGDYKPAQISRELVEKELVKFVGEIANW